jgi:hypothetical protein
MLLIFNSVEIQKVFTDGLHAHAELDCFHRETVVVEPFGYGKRAAPTARGVE